MIEKINPNYESDLSWYGDFVRETSSTYDPADVLYDFKYLVQYNYKYSSYNHPSLWVWHSCLHPDSDEITLNYMVVYKYFILSLQYIAI